MTNPSLAEQPAPIGSTTTIEINAKYGSNMGQPTLLATMPVAQFLSQSMVGNSTQDGAVTQRELDLPHAKKMALFILKGLVHYTRKTLQKHGHETGTAPGHDVSEEIEEIIAFLGEQTYYAWAPLVCALRCKPTDIQTLRLDDFAEARRERVIKLNSSQVLWVVDGQHRRRAWQLAQDFLLEAVEKGKYQRSLKVTPTQGAFKKGKVGDDAKWFWNRALEYFKSHFTVTVEIHYGLSIDQERQLFHDLNNLHKSVSISKAQQFDSSNPINLFTQRMVGELELQDRISNDKNPKWEDFAWMTLKTMNGINARLFWNKTTILGAQNKAHLIHSREETAAHFWRTVMEIPDVTSPMRSVAGQTILIKSMARIVYDILWSRAAKKREDDVNQRRLAAFFDALPTLNFQHDNAIWTIEGMSEKKVKATFPGLLTRLPDNWKTKTIGKRKGKHVHFTTKHNDAISVLPSILMFLCFGELGEDEVSEEGARVRRLEAEKAARPKSKRGRKPKKKNEAS